MMFQYVVACASIQKEAMEEAIRMLEISEVTHMPVFTHRYIESLRPTKGKRPIYRDRDGFAIRVAPSGLKTWVYLYDMDGRRRQMGLGTFPEVSLQDAREACRQARSLRAAGIDPQTKKLAEAKERREAPTVQDIVDDYLESEDFLDLSRTTKMDYRRTFEKDLLPHYGSCKAAEITKKDIRRILRRVIARGKVQAARTKAHLHKLFNFAYDEELVPFNPCYRVKVKHKPAKRDVVLKRGEISVFWQWLDETPKITEPIKMVYRIMLATAQRKAEVCRARWEDIDWEEAIWTIPPGNSKNGKQNEVPLSSFALELLRRLHELTGETPYLVPSQRHPERHICRQSVNQSIWANRDSIPIKKRFIPHDLRRTAATELRRVWIPRGALKRILNHAEAADVTAVYDRYDFENEKRKYLEEWGRVLNNITRLQVIQEAASA